MGTLPHRPVVAIDVDGTIAQYHDHFVMFARQWLGDDNLVADWSKTENGEFSDALGLDKHTYRQIKLAYRQGGMKRTIPLWEGAKDLVDAIHAEGAEVWFCTTRPWERFDNIDPDTRHFFERNGLTYEGLLYGEDKYADLVEIVGKDRIVAVLDDEPEQYMKARELGLAPILRLDDHNNWFMIPDNGTGLLSYATQMIVDRIRRWKEERVANGICGLKGCNITSNHSHGTDPVRKPDVEKGDAEFPDEVFVHRGGRRCVWNQKKDQWRYGETYQHRCVERHNPKPQGAVASRQCVNPDCLAEEGSRHFARCAPDDNRVEGAIQTPSDRGEFGMPAIGLKWTTPEVGAFESLPQVQMRPGDVWEVVKEPTWSNWPLSRVERVCNIMDEAQELYRTKAAGYKDTADLLGAKGQFADINRKYWRLYHMLWVEDVSMYPDAGEGESVEEILMDFIGHASLTIDFLRQQQAAEDTKKEGQE